MKSIIIFLIATLATCATFAQKAKANSDTTKKNTIIVTQYACPMHPDVTSDKPGKCSKCNMDLTKTKKELMKAEVTHTYTCPMHSEVISNGPGTCAKCSSKLVVDRRGSKQGVVVYTCSMHPDVKSDVGGKCPKCNMDLTVEKTKVKSE